MRRGTAVLILSAAVFSAMTACVAKKPQQEPAAVAPASVQMQPEVKPQAPAPKIPEVGKSIQMPSVNSPEILIGLSSGNEAHKISSFNGFLVVRKDLKLLLFHENQDGEISVVAKNPSAADETPMFSVEVGSYKTEEDAAEDAAMLEKTLKAEIKIEENKYDHHFRIKFDPLPEAMTEPLTAKLSSLGMENVRVLPLSKNETQPAVFIRLFDAEGSRIADTDERLVCFTENPADYIRYDGTPYRGLIEIFINTSGKLTVVNRVNLEDYLKGVVPGEMSGKVYPMLEALKAQAVAARTYAVKNLGQFSKSGYDLCATPLCQVYKGVSAESDLTNRAVDETAGIVAAFNGELINALYTSTCGGHTENVENIFPDIKAEYMRGVTCYPESTSHGIILISNEVHPLIANDGKSVNHEIALLDTAGFIDNTLPLRDETVTSAGLNLWIKRLADFLHLNTKPQAVRHSLNAVSLWHSASAFMNLLNWEKRISLFLDERDTVDLNQFKDFKSLPKESLKEISYLLREEIITPFHDNTLRLDRSLNYPTLARMVYRFIASYNLISVKNGIFLSYDNGRISMLINGEPADYSVVPQPLLFFAVSGEYSAADRLLIRPGDKIEFLTEASSSIKFLSLLSHRKGISDDRFSNLYYWKQSFTADEMNRQVNSFVKVGKIKDITPLEYGVSGRVTKLKITGSQGSADLKGLEIRRVLGIKENLFTMERINNSAGEIAYYFFYGKGWGHGVGMCQVGAYGMALRGAKYDEILKHYYTGIELRQIVAK